MALNVDKKSLVSVEGVSFSYGTTPVLIDVTFSIMPDDFLAIIGPNGSGKTTLLKIILGILQPSSGVVQLMGEDVKHFSHWERLGYVPQKATHVDPFFPASVREVVAMGLLSQKRFPRLLKHKDEKAIDEAIEKVNMRRLKNRRIGELSGGEQQRVFIARAIVNNPAILFLDEPTTGVDAEGQARFYDMLDELNKTYGITIVLITHDISVITKHARKVACLNQRLVFHGTHEEFCNSAVVQEILRGDHHLVCHRH
ncbi:MAG: metal ABC transporter ATP-binding protein [Nitrospirota bacterium]